MIAVRPGHQVRGGEQRSSGAIFLLALIALAGTTFLFVIGAYSALVYVVIAACSLVAFAAPARWGIATMVAFGGVAGMLKDIAAYETLAHLGNDFVLVSLLLGHAARSLMRREPLVPDFPFKKTIGFLIVSATFLTFLPLTRPLVALGGWKGYVVPALVVPVVYLGLREPNSSRPVVGALVITGIGNAIASLVEQGVGPNAVASWGPGFVHNIASYTFAFDTAGHLVWRPFGLTQGAGDAAIVEVLAATVLMYMGFGRRPLVQWMVGFAAILCAIAVLESSVRTAILMLIAGVMGVIVVRGFHRRQSLAVGLLVVMLVGGSLAFVFQGAPGAVQGRVVGLLDTNTYLNGRGAVIGLVGNAAFTLPLGLGMGRATPGSEVLASLAGVQNEALSTENALLVMIFELGWAGIIFIGLLAWQLGGVVKQYLLNVARDREGGLAAVIVLVLMLAGLSGPILVAQPENLYVWIFGTLAYMRLSAGAPELDETPEPALA
jgi:hypothetical protein